MNQSIDARRIAVSKTADRSFVCKCSHRFYARDQGGTMEEWIEVHVAEGQNVHPPRSGDSGPN